MTINKDWCVALPCLLCPRSFLLIPESSITFRRVTNSEKLKGEKANCMKEKNGEMEVAYRVFKGSNNSVLRGKNGFEILLVSLLLFFVSFIKKILFFK